MSRAALTQYTNGCVPALKWSCQALAVVVPAAAECVRVYSCVCVCTHVQAMECRRKDEIEACAKRGLRYADSEEAIAKLVGGRRSS